MVTRNRTQHVPNFTNWPLTRLVGEAKRLGVPSLKSILREQDESMAKRELIDILTEAYS